MRRVLACNRQGCVMSPMSHQDVNGVVWFEIMRKKAHLFYMRMDYTESWQVLKTRLFSWQMTTSAVMQCKAYPNKSSSDP